jgi:hypothetical protein
MPSSTRIGVPNGVIFVTDSRGGSIPDPVQGLLVQSTPSCIGVECMIDSEGDTEVVMGATREVDPGNRPAFDAPLETPNRAVVVSTVDGRIMLETAVSRSITRVRIWVNRQSEADKVVIGLD